VVSVDSPFVLYRASIERGEFRARRAGAEDVVELDVRRWFHGHPRLEESPSFMIRAAAQRAFELSRSVVAVTADLPSPPFTPGGFQLTITRAGSRARMPSLPLTADGYLGAGAPTKFSSFGHELRPPVGFVPTGRVAAADMLSVWTRLVLTPGEERTLTALRLVDPTVDRVAMSGVGDAVVAQVLVKGSTSPVPLGTLGEGVSRMLSLAVHLAATQGGFLLVDEIENGLYWAALPKVWRFLVETARALDVQVFATTHSKDCLEAIADLHRRDPALAQHVSVHRLEAGRDKPIRFDAAAVAEYVSMDLETR
jgi:hypothetical protein